jgi:DNA-binding NtrC family response regulator
MNDTKILGYSQSPAFRQAVQQAQPVAAGCKLEWVPTLEDAVTAIDRGGVGAVVVHVCGAADEDRLGSLLKEISQGPYLVPVIVVTEQADADFRRQTLEQGAVDCLSRPLDLSRLAFLLDILTVGRRYQPVEAPPARPRKPVSVPAPEAGFLAVSRAGKKLREQVGAVAALDATVLLTGETGTGKTHLAQLIHELSPRKDRPFVVLACGGLTPSLLESELFGHVRGAYTDAQRDHLGKFAAAEDGTLLLDEVDCLPVAAQMKLLRVLERRVYEAVGSNQLQPFCGRLIAATNRPLRGEVTAGRFRSDLYYRLCVVEFEVPPLRRRREAIRPLAAKFLADYSTGARRPLREFTPAALQALENYVWPGNVRELRNAIERASALCTGDCIDLADLPEDVRRRPEASHHTPKRGPAEDRLPLAAARKLGELQILTAALERHPDDPDQVADELGISRTALARKLLQHGLSY